MLARICRFIFRQPEGDENNVEKIQQYRQGPHSLGCQVTHHQRFCLLCDAFRVPHSSLPAHQMISIFCWSRLPFIVADMPFSLRPTHGVRAVAVSTRFAKERRCHGMPSPAEAIELIRHWHGVCMSGILLRIQFDARSYRHDTDVISKKLKYSEKEIVRNLSRFAEDCDKYRFYCWSLRNSRLHQLLCLPSCGANTVSSSFSLLLHFLVDSKLSTRTQHCRRQTVSPMVKQKREWKKKGMIKKNEMQEKCWIGFWSAMLCRSHRVAFFCPPPAFVSAPKY